MGRLADWWAGLSGTQRTLVAVGVPVAGGAALVANLRGESEPEPQEGAEDQAGISGPAVGFAVGNEDVVAEIGAIQSELIEQTTTALADTEARISDSLQAVLGSVASGQSQITTAVDALTGLVDAAAGERDDVRDDLEASPPKAPSEADRVEAAILNVFREEHLPAPSSGRLARLVIEVQGGRSLANIRAGLEAYKENRPDLGIPV